MSKVQRGPRGPRGLKGEPGMTGPVGPTGAPGMTQKPEWKVGDNISPGIHARRWRDAITGIKLYEIVRITIFHKGEGPEVMIISQEGDPLTDHQIANSYFLRIE